MVVAYSQGLLSALGLLKPEWNFSCLVFILFLGFWGGEIILIDNSQFAADSRDTNTDTDVPDSDFG